MSSSRELYDSSRNRELQQLLSIEKSLVYFINALNGNELLKMKMKRADFLSIRHDEDLWDLFEDIIIDNGQALEMANIYTNILNGTMDAYGSIISNNLNITIQRLTLITIVLTVPMVIASFLRHERADAVAGGELYFYSDSAAFHCAECGGYFIISGVSGCFNRRARVRTEYGTNPTAVAAARGCSGFQLVSGGWW